MKFTTTAVLGALLAAGAANAQAYDPSGDSTFRVARGYISASTPVTDRKVQDTKADLYVVHRCGTVVSLSIINKLDDGTVLNSQTVACDTTPRIVSWTAPIWFEKIAVSPTTAVSTTAGGASSTIIETKK